MQFGVSIFPTHFSAGPAEVAAEAERLGFESFFVSEHSHIPVDTVFPFGGEVPDGYRSMLDPFVALAAAAAATDKIKLGTSICLITQHDPINCAKAVSSLDQVSNGRFLFGIGAGWNPPEMANHGTNPDQRYKLTRERIEAMKELWTEEEAEYHGELVDFSRSWQWPKPVQQPYPPIFVAGAGPNILKRVVRYGDGWLPYVVAPSEWSETMENRMIPLENFESLLADLKRLGGEAGRGHLPTTVVGLLPEPEIIERLIALGVDRMVLRLPQAGMDEVSAQLNAYVEAVSNYRD